MEAKSVSSRVSRYMIAVNDEDITYYGRDKTLEAKRSGHMYKVAKLMLVLPSDPLVKADVDVDIWSLRYYCDRSYVANLCDLSIETLPA